MSKTSIILLLCFALSLTSQRLLKLHYCSRAELIESNPRTENYQRIEETSNQVGEGGEGSGGNEGGGDPVTTTDTIVDTSALENNINTAVNLILSNHSNVTIEWGLKILTREIKNEADNEIFNIENDERTLTCASKIFKFKVNYPMSQGHTQHQNFEKISISFNDSFNIVTTPLPSRYTVYPFKGTFITHQRKAYSVLRVNKKSKDVVYTSIVLN